MRPRRLALVSVAAVLGLVPSACGREDESAEETRSQVVAALQERYGGSEDCIREVIDPLSSDELDELQELLADEQVDMTVDDLRPGAALAAAACGASVDHP